MFAATANFEEFVRQQDPTRERLLSPTAGLDRGSQVPVSSIDVFGPETGGTRTRSGSTTTPNVTASLRP